MRGIPGTAFFLFLTAILLVEIVAYLSIMQVTSGKKRRKTVSIFYWFVTVATLTVWLTAFLNPASIRETENYQFFYFVISLSVLNLAPKIVLCYFFLASLLPFLFKARQLSKLILTSGLIISIGTMLTIGAGIIIERKTIKLESIELRVKGLPEQLNGKTLVQLSDIHLGSFSNDKFLKKCANSVNQLSPDLIVFTGDMVNNYYSEMIGFEEELAEMHAPLGKYAILGNHDYGDYSNWETETAKNENNRKLRQAIEDTGFKLLLNSSVELKVADTSFFLIGVENWGHAPFPQYANLNEAIKNVPEKAFKILLTHDPAHWKAKVLQETNIQLTLSGHTHGAQTGFHFAGIEFSPMFLVQEFWGGLYESEDRYLYVNRGLGCVGLLGRIDMRPEITRIKLLSDIIETN